MSVSDREKIISVLRKNRGLIATADVSATSLLRLADALVADGVTVQKRGGLGISYVDEYFGPFADCKECSTDNILPCKFCRECGAKMEA